MMLTSVARCGGVRLPARQVPQGTCQRRIASKPRLAVKAQMGPEHASVLEATLHHMNVLAAMAGDAATNAADAVTTAAADATSTAAATTAAAASTAASAATQVAARSGDGGPMDALAIGFENVLEFLDDVLEKANVPYSYGFSIILLTVLVKLATFPLSQKQVQSTVAIQALSPRVKELQAKYANDQETLQLETARLYRDAGVNPLAGCLPTLATIPVFIGLYRALTLAAQDNLLDQDFFWIPSLSGPASLADQASGAGLNWLFPFVDGHPPIGWGPAGAYLVLPVLLVISQFVTQKILSPGGTTNDPAQQQTQNILKFLPLMIGWFSLNVPAGLTLYWFVNNILSTGQQLYLKKVTKVNIPGENTDPNTIVSGSTPYISPKEEKVKRVSGKDVNARRKRKEDEGDVVDVEVLSSSTAEPATPTSNGAAQKKTVNGGKGDKFRARKAREAAAKAASVATPAASSSGDNKSSNE